MGRVAVIGMGAVCAAGADADSGFRAVAEGRCCLSPLALFESGLANPPLCGQVPQEFLPEGDFPNRTTALAMAACNQAFKGLFIDRGNRLGVVAATTVAGMDRSERFYRELLKNPAHVRTAAIELANHEPAALAGVIGRAYNAAGVHALSTACSTGLHAAGMAKRMIEAGAYDLCLAVGADALCLLTVRGFASLTLLDPAGCRPFDRDRAGISLGEGAGALLLASDRTVTSLGVNPLAFVCSWGATSDCHHMTAPHPDGDGARRAAQSALAEAGVDAAAVGCIAAHGTGTPDNDAAEMRAMRKVFAGLPPFYSQKRVFGHTLAASGILESVFAIQAMTRGLVPPSAGFCAQDDAIGASPSPGEQRRIDYVLKNSFGFGGNNACVVLGKQRQAA